MGNMHHAWTESSTLCLRCVSGANLQAEPRWQGTWRSRRNWKTAEAIWLDPRDRVPVRECALRSRTAELARAETCAPSNETVRVRRAYPHPRQKARKVLERNDLSLDLAPAYP